MRDNYGTLFASVVALTVVEIGATSSIARWSKTDENIWLCMGLSMFTLLGLVMAISIRAIDHMNTVNALWQSISIAGVSMVSAYFFEETITNKQWFGVALAILASLCVL